VLIGNGPVQVAVVLLVAATLARLVDRGSLVTTQAGSQSMIVMGLPAIAATGGPLGRWTDALVGAVVAILVVVLSPVDPRRPAREVSRRALGPLVEVLGLLARGLRDRDPDDVEE